MTRVLVLGASGMLGSACFQVLNQSSHLTSVGTSRASSNKLVKFDSNRDSIIELLELTKPDWIVNCIGIIKPYIDEKSAPSIGNAIKINSQFPFILASAAKDHNAKIIQIATDCVYSGKSGKYKEHDLHDATDVYGKTKSLGEVPGPQTLHLRASIIGPEIGRSTSLLEWFRNQPIGATVNGFTDHLWNGVTTYHFGRVVKGIIDGAIGEFGTVHLIPKDIITKAELLRIFAETYKRDDIKINDVLSSNTIDRTLATENAELSNRLWKLAGFENPPSIREMVLEQESYFRN